MKITKNNNKILRTQKKLKNTKIPNILRIIIQKTQKLLRNTKDPKSNKSKDNKYKKYKKN